ncbi:unnamed protein product [Caenorhabditis sp. 36 PRJEB53466]|nr:unnamed protein product [Caenorhabditis sp. 36 PRJEB53466]
MKTHAKTLPPFKIHEGTVKQDFEKLHKDGRSLLESDEKYLVFCGLAEFTDRACVHVDLKNPTKNAILFNIRKPEAPGFFVRPHVGMVEPSKKVTLYFTFKGTCSRLPSDYCWIYSVYQISIDQKSLEFIKLDEFGSTNLRAVWNEQGRGDIANILHLSSRFDITAKPKFTCKNHKNKARRIQLNEIGEVLDTGTIEESGTPAARSASKRTPQSTISELPKTAQ